MILIAMIGAGIVSTKMRVVQSEQQVWKSVDLGESITASTTIDVIYVMEILILTDVIVVAPETLTTQLKTIM